jgi:PIN like domain
MAEARKKSGKRSGGKGNTEKQPHNYRSTLYLDENLCECVQIHKVLTDAAFPFKRHLEFFPRGTLDKDWLPLPGSKGWPVLTKDKAQRYTPLEKTKIVEHNLKIFAFSSGNLSGADMADLLKTNLRRLDKFARKQVPPFVASISKTGVSLRKL